MGNHRFTLAITCLYKKEFVSKNATPKHIHSYIHSEHLRFQHIQTGRVTCTYISSKQTYTGMCIHTGTTRKQQLNYEHLRTISLKKKTFSHLPRKHRISPEKNYLKVSNFELFFGCFYYFFSQGKTVSGNKLCQLHDSVDTASADASRFWDTQGSDKENRDPYNGFLVGGLRRSFSNIYKHLGVNNVTSTGIERGTFFFVAL